MQMHLELLNLPQQACAFLSQLCVDLETPRHPAHMSEHHNGRTDSVRLMHTWSKKGPHQAWYILCT